MVARGKWLAAANRLELLSSAETLDVLIWIEFDDSFFRRGSALPAMLTLAFYAFSKEPTDTVLVLQICLENGC